MDRYRSDLFVRSWSPIILVLHGDHRLGNIGSGRSKDNGARRCSWRPSAINSAATVDILPSTSFARDKVPRHSRRNATTARPWSTIHPCCDDRRHRHVDLDHILDRASHHRNTRVSCPGIVHGTCIPYFEICLGRRMERVTLAGDQGKQLSGSFEFLLVLDVRRSGVSIIDRGGRPAKRAAALSEDTAGKARRARGLIWASWSRRSTERRWWKRRLAAARRAGRHGASSLTTRADRARDERFRAQPGSSSSRSRSDPRPGLKPAFLPSFLSAFLPSFRFGAMHFAGHQWLLLAPTASRWQPGTRLAPEQPRCALGILATIIPAGLR